ncbi:acetyltransferase [Fodinibius sp.]|uniref:acetyltransferase n=1 Tax=Fodinibius sp. TaxID=1872440 RepID=UPI002ACD2553|nr:acetyltransferase [Fodinibius sp.]MDZ7657720.1 acetyltransferase [Fodinibius sp.]
MKDGDRAELAENVREACINAAREGFQDAAMSGLCTEGSMEAAISAMQNLKLDKVIHDEE